MAEFCVEEIIGMHIDSAKAWLFVRQKIYRITQIDDKRSITTADYRPDRVNLKLDKDYIVVSASFE
jgi:hypothetical protein